MDYLLDSSEKVKMLSTLIVGCAATREAMKVIKRVSCSLFGGRNSAEAVENMRAMVPAHQG